MLGLIREEGCLEDGFVELGAARVFALTLPKIFRLGALDSAPLVFLIVVFLTC
jgi:hypothetical protein